MDAAVTTEERGVERPKRALPLAMPPAARAPSAAQAVAPVAGGANRVVVRALVALLGALVALVTLACVAVPWLVRREFVDAAAERGVTVTVQSVEMRLTGFALQGVDAVVDTVHGVHLTAPVMEVQMSGVSPQKVAVHGAELLINGRWSAVTSDIDRWLMSANGASGGEIWAPRSLVIDGSRIAWQGLAGDGVAVQAAGLHLEATWPEGERPTWHATAEPLTIALPQPRAPLGPWRVDVERSTGASRVRVAFDPGVPDSSWLVVLGDDKAIASVDLVVPRSPIARLGIPTALLGLGGDLQLTATAHYVALGPRTSATFSGGVFGAKAAGLPRPIDVVWEGSASGDTGGSLDVKSARVAVGPLTGAARGTLKPFDDGFRLDLAWNAAAVPCAAFDAPLDPTRPFDIGYELRQLAEGVGIAKVSGTVSARASLAFDSRDLAGSSVTFAPDVTCKIGLFDAP
jgi:hypothetical protein